VVHVSDHNKDIAKTQDTSHYSLTYDEVKQQFDQLNTGPINLACTQWSRAASALGTIANRLMSEAGGPLHSAWQSQTSPDAQKHLQEAQATAHALADQCMQMARATDYAYKYADWYKAHLPGDGYVTTGGDAQRAVDHLAKMLGRYNEVIATVVPSQVRASFVDSNANQDKSNRDDFKPGGPGGGGGPSAPHMGGAPPLGGAGAGGAGALGGPDGLGGAGAGGPGVGDSGFGAGAGAGAGGAGDPFGSGLGSGGAGSGIGGSGSDFGSPYDAGSALAGGGGSGGLGGGLDGLGGGGTGFGGGLGSGGAGSGGGLGGGLGAGAGAGGGIGAGGIGGGLPGGGAGGAGAGRGGLGAGAGGGAGGGAGAGAGRGGAPMHGGQDGGEEDRERSTWLTEDDDVWGGDTDAPPLVVGG
jgi:type II secretory pathway pseudopilin PulG